MSPKATLADCWYRGCAWLYLLAPAAGLFALLSWLRRRAFRLGLARTTRLRVPVIVVGNIAVGGTGKTPLVLWLAERLRQAGYRPGIIARGYAGTARTPLGVGADTPAEVCGDEPLLLARRAGCPVWIGARRAEAGQALLAAHPEVNLLISDDGLQHYALARDIEIALVDGARGLGNGWRLPAGPLREPAKRLAEVDALVVHGSGGDEYAAPGVARFAMHLVGGEFANVTDPTRRATPEAFAGAKPHAIAGIGHPERFFATLASLGLRVVAHAFPDHHAYRPEDLPPGPVLMTEKDAVKCAGLGRDDLWALRVDAQVEDGLQTLILNKLKLRHGQQTT